MENADVLVDRFGGERTLARDILWVVGFSLLTALMAHLEFFLPFTPVPVTGQTFAVLLSGAVLGSRRGFACQALYLAEGLAGLPVFAIASFGTSAGYLLCYPVAAGLVGLMVERGWASKVWRLALALAAADALILTSGSAWLVAVAHLTPRQAWLEGAYPFLVGDTIKIAFVGISLPTFLKKIRFPEQKPTD